MSALKRLRNIVQHMLPSKSESSYARLFAGSSLAENDDRYLEVCREAVFSAKVFSKFRSDPRYQSILEHVTPELGKQYYDLTKPELQSDATLKEAARNDLFGSPSLVEIKSGTSLSPTTLRYLKVASDLDKEFGSLDGYRIAEIGVGYGGQCRILDSLHRIASYTLVDLRPALNLAEYYLSHYALRTSALFRTMNELAPEAYDLVISNYAFTELRREVQETYLTKILMKSTKGYITYNRLTPPDYNSISLDELKERLGAQIQAEEPLTHTDNCILVWGGSSRHNTNRSKTLV